MNLLGAIRIITQIIAAIGLAALVLLSLIMMADIIGREAFDLPIPGFSDVTDLIILIAAASCFPAALANKQHVAVRFAGMIHWRIREFLDSLGHLIMLIVFIIMAQQLYIYTTEVYQTNQTTWLLYIPIWPAWALTTLLFALCVPTQLLVFCNVVKRNFSATPLADEDEISGQNPAQGE